MAVYRVTFDVDLGPEWDPVDTENGQEVLVPGVTTFARAIAKWERATGLSNRTDKVKFVEAVELRDE